MATLATPICDIGFAGMASAVWLLTPPPGLIAGSRRSLPLSVHEWEQSDRYRFEADRVGYAAAHTLARVVLAAIAQCDPSDIRFMRRQEGKPSAVWPKVLEKTEFNLSHTNGLVGLAVSNSGAVGLDIESIDRAVDCRALAPSVLAESERDRLDCLPENKRTGYFLQLWTLKEAYLKARGTGLGIDLRSIAFKLVGSSIDLDPPQGESRFWKFSQTVWPTGHLVSVCHAGSRANAQFRDGSSACQQYFDGSLIPTPSALPRDKADA